MDIKEFCDIYREYEKYKEEHNWKKEKVEENLTRIYNKVNQFSEYSYENDFFREREIKNLKEMKVVTDTRNQTLKNLKENEQKFSDTGITERILCKELFKSSFYNKEIYDFKFDDYPVSIINYELPLYDKKKSEKDDYSFKGIDLIGISQTNDDNTFNIYIIEVKNENSNERVIRAVTEVLAYSKLIELQREKFNKDLKQYIQKYDGLNELLLSLNGKEDSFNFNFKKIIIMREGRLKNDKNYQCAEDVITKSKQLIDDIYFYSLDYKECKELEPSIIISNDSFFKKDKKVKIELKQH